MWESCCPHALAPLSKCSCSWVTFWTPFCSLDGFVRCHGSASSPNDGSLAVIVHMGMSAPSSRFIPYHCSLVYPVPFFPLALLRFFSLSQVLSDLIIMCLGISFFVSWAWGLLSFLDLLLYMPMLVLCRFLVLDCYLYLGCLFVSKAATV